MEKENLTIFLWGVICKTEKIYGKTESEEVICKFPSKAKSLLFSLLLPYIGFFTTYLRYTVQSTWCKKIEIFFFVKLKFKYQTIIRCNFKFKKCNDCLLKKNYNFDCDKKFPTSIPNLIQREGKYYIFLGIKACWCKVYTRVKSSKRKHTKNERNPISFSPFLSLYSSVCSFEFEFVRNIST